MASHIMFYALSQKRPGLENSLRIAHQPSSCMQTASHIAGDVDDVLC